MFLPQELFDSQPQELYPQELFLFKETIRSPMRCFSPRSCLIRTLRSCTPQELFLFKETIRSPMRCFSPRSCLIRTLRSCIPPPPPELFLFKENSLPHEMFLPQELFDSHPQELYPQELFLFKETIRSHMRCFSPRSCLNRTLRSCTPQETQIVSSVCTVVLSCARSDLLA